MKNRAIKIGIIATIAPHIFCCGLPILMAIVGLIAPDAAHFHILPHWAEPWLFILSGIMLITSWYLIVRDCKCTCDTCHNKSSHKTQKIILSIITILFIASIILHLYAH